MSFEQMDLLEICISAVGLFLLVNGIIIAFSTKYYNYFSKTLFIERFPNTDRQLLDQKIKAQHAQSRLVVSGFLIFFGFMAVAWAIGFKSALGWPFNVLF